MATTPKVLYRGAASLTTTTTLYTVPSATTTVATNIAVTNTDSTEQTFTLSLDGVVFAEQIALQNNATLTFDVKQVLVATDTIQGGASSTNVNFHICGVEIV